MPSEVVMRNLSQFSMPIVMDNRNLRQKNPDIERHFRASQEEMERFPLENGVIRSSDYVDFVPCPVCGCNHTKQWLIKWGGRYDLCENCNHVFLKNRLKVDILNDFYRSSIADEMDRKVNENDFNKTYWDRVYTKYLGVISELIERSQDEIQILDIGCGAGGFVKKAHNAGFPVSAIDIYEGVVEKIGRFIGEKQVKCVKSLDAYQTKHSFDVVTLWGVLEHLPNGEHAFELARKVFKKRGLILFLVPNLQSRAFRFLGANTPTLNPRQHINFYSDESIYKLAGRHGFDFVASFDELPVIDLMWDFMDGADDHIISDIVEKRESYYRVYIYEYSESR